jgi:osmotically-inducible protein OsmY
MQKLKCLTLTVAILGFGLMSCKPKNNESTISELKSGASNADIEKSVMTIFQADDQLRKANLIVTADGDKKEATLSGTVESDALRNRAIDLAKSALSDFTVNDNIAVKPSEIGRKDFTEDLAKQEWEKAKQVGDKVGDTLDDAWLHGKILGKLIANPRTAARNINVDVVGGVVTLRGNVSNAEQKSEVERTAKETEGVKNVENQLKVSA